MNKKYLFDKEMLPSLRKVKSRHANRIDKLKQLIGDNLFNDNLNDDEPFFFNKRI